MRIATWNVNGIRAISKKTDFTNFLYGSSSPDILGLQEVKISPEQITNELSSPKEFNTYWNCAEQKGYSGTAIFSKFPASEVIIDYPHPNFSHEYHNKEGRVIGADYGEFMFFTIYFPNGGKNPEHFRYKFLFYKTIFEYFEDLRKLGKKLVISGDFNIAHTEKDIARAKDNEMSIGFTIEERELLDTIISKGYVDCFREFQTDAGHYTWWHYFTKARDRNIGWRIDYIFITPDLRPFLKSARILNDVFGSDHCPVEIELDLPFEKDIERRVIAKTQIEPIQNLQLAL